MKLFTVEMLDVGSHSWENYHVMAKDEETAWEYVKADNNYESFASRPHKIEAHEEGEVIVDMY